VPGETTGGGKKLQVGSGTQGSGRRQEGSDYWTLDSLLSAHILPLVTCHHPPSTQHLSSCPPTN